MDRVYETLVVDDAAPGIVVVRLARPDRLNAIDEVMVRELGDVCAAIAAEGAIRAVVLTGTGRGFCSGLDLRDFGASAPGADGPTAEVLAFQEMMAALPGRLRDLPQPVVAAVNGAAVGGGMALCLACDIRVCGESAAFANAAIRIGLTGAEMGMSYHLPRVVGASVAADWMLTGRMVPAEEALRAGLVSALVPDDELLDHALGLATQIAEHSLLALQMTKRALQVNVDAPSLAAALELENRNQVITGTTEDAAAARARWARRR